LAHVEHDDADGGDTTQRVERVKDAPFRYERRSAHLPIQRRRFRGNVPSPTRTEHASEVPTDESSDFHLDDMVIARRVSLAPPLVWTFGDLL